MIRYNILIIKLNFRGVDKECERNEHSYLTEADLV